MARALRRLGPLLVLLLIAVAAVPAAPATAAVKPPAPDTIATGVRVGGVAIGGLSRRAARNRLFEQLAVRMRAPIRVHAAGRLRVAYAGALGWKLDLDVLVAQAYRAGRRAGAPRVIPARPSIDRAAVAAFVGRLADAVRVTPRSARLHYSLKRVWVTPHRTGRRLRDQGRLGPAIVAAFSNARAPRFIAWRVDPVTPAARTVDVRRANRVFVTVSKAERKVRVFRWLRIVKRYTVAIGQPGYPTPEGLFQVRSKQVDPAWSVPRSSWAGGLGGTTVPGGSDANPLKARWIGFAGGVGFHGTADVGSIGSAASHGCVRMRVPDVKDLYRRVNIGTPVYVS